MQNTSLKNQAMIKVKNVNAAPHYNCACGNWLNHWVKFSTNKTAYCAAADCNTIASCGAHVQKADSDDELWYVIPLCAIHATVKQEFEVWKGYKLVSARVDLTCERW